MARFTNPYPQYIFSGSALSGGKVYFYESGTTDTPLDTYSDATLETVNPNPVILDDDGGLPDVWMQDLDYKVDWYDANDTFILSIDPVDGSSGASTATLKWNADQTYAEGQLAFDDTVSGSGPYWKSIVADNQGNQPSDSGSAIYWSELVMHDIYNENETYAEDDVVWYDGIAYVSRVDSNIGNQPDTSPDEWANMSGIGTQTVNIGASAFNLPSSNAPAVSTESVGNLLIPGAAFDGTTAESAQFTFRLPAGYDSSVGMQAIVTYDLLTAGTGTSSAFAVSVYGLASGSTQTTPSFTTTVEGVLTGLSANTQYISDVFDVNESGELAAGNKAYFQIRRDPSSSNDDVSEDVRIEEVTILYYTLSSVDNA